MCGEYCEREGFIAYEVTKLPVMAKGGGYMGVPYTIDIKGRTEDGEKVINLFVKTAISNSTLDSMFSAYTAYMNECFMYKELAEVFQKLQTEAGIPVEDKFKMVKGFKASTSEAIVLENITQKGFKSYNRMEIAKVKFIEMALDQLAKFHALGFVIHKKMPQYFDKKIRAMEFPVKFNDIWKKLCKPLLKLSTKDLKSEAKKKAEDFIPIFFSNFEKYIRDKNTVGTICHGDFRANNILIKEVGGDVTEIIPIDYQTIHYGCPVNDVLHIIYGCTDQAFRNAHKNRVIDFYYQTLCRFLNYFDLDAAEVYPRKELNRALEERADYGLMMALYYYPAYFAPEDDIPDVTEDLSNMDFSLDSQIVIRLEEIIEEYENIKVL